MNAYWKDLFREIKNTPGRFISLLIMTMLGAASLVGIQATSIDMRDVADKTYKEHNLYDLQLKSSVGFDDDDVKALSITHGVSDLMPTVLYDVYININDENQPVRTYSLPDNINNIDIISGRLPANSNECAVEQRMLDDGGIGIGDKIEFGLDDMTEYRDTFKTDSFTVVGVVSSPLYITFERGNTSLGDGTLSYYLYLDPKAYDIDVYTDVYLLMDESQNIDNLTDDYYALADSWKDKIKETEERQIEIKEDELADGQKKIDDGRNEYLDNKNSFDEGIFAGKQKLTDAKKELDEGKAELEKGERTLNKKIKAGNKKIEKSKAGLLKNQKKVDNGLAEIKTGESQLNAARKQVEDTLADLSSQGPPGVSAVLDGYYAKAYASLKKIDEQQAELDSNRAILIATQKKLKDGFKEIDKAGNKLKKEEASAREEIEDGWAKYNEGLYSYNAGLLTLETEESDGLTKLNDAETKLEDAQEKLDKAPAPEWFTLLREDGGAFDSYYQDTHRLQKIGYVFPLVFFLVAIMVTLTTMSRMVENDRTQIGIYKALGYRRTAILMKYLIYAFSASVAGGVIGIVLGCYIFPTVISDAYGHLYDMPPINTPIPMVIATISLISAVTIVLLVTLITYLVSMSGNPALLMRPKAPLNGKRVLLERVTFIWNRLGFFSKVTARNVFRYKRRFIMTLVGIAGCSALLLTAYGLNDSIVGVAELQYEKIVKYNAQVYLKDINEDKQKAELDGLLPEKHLYISEEAVTSKSLSGSLSGSLIVPEYAGKMNEYFNFYDPVTEESVPMDSDGVLITEKMSRVTALGVGDELTVVLSDGREYQVGITGVVDNYLKHYIYMSPDVYGKAISDPPAINSALIIEENEKGYESLLLDNENVRALINNDEIMSRINDSTSAMGIVTIVLIILACALAMVVLFNLTNINISERIRELATMKVLGLNDRELAMYIYRENGIVTILGILLGLVGGIFLHGYVLSSVEIDVLKFPRIIEPHSYIIAIVLSLAFAVFVNLVMSHKLARIDMVESLKSVE